ncbi:MAG: hypothetical protein J6C16_01570, partial [Clostridia bacterium]|nr:hypothetical protein [Clostridia bacterium]
LDPTKTDCLDITVDTSAFKVSNMANSVVIKEYTYAFTSKNLTLDLREEMTGVAASGKTVTYDGNTHNIEVTGAPSGSTITYKCENAAFTGTKDAGEYEVTATVECPGYKPLTLEPETLIINEKELTANVNVADSRAYNGTNIVDVTVTLNGKVGADDVAIADVPTEGTMADKHVGENKVVTIDTLELTGTDAANYTLTQPAKPTINITKANVEFKGISDSIKINEELPTGTLYETIGTIFSGDTVSGNFKVDINGSLEATTYNIINNDVTIDDGNNGDNYNVTYADGVLIVELDKHPDPIAAELSLTYGEAKEFALTLVDVEADTVTVEPINEEVVTVSYDAAAKKITVTPVEAGNTEIIVTVPETATCEEKVFAANVAVAKKALTYTVTAEEKIYNADYDFVANVVLDGVVNDDDVYVDCIGATIPEKNVGEYVGKAQLKLIGPDAENYVFANEKTNEIIVNHIEVAVVPKEITATVEPVDRVYDGTLDFETLVSLDGVLAVDEEFVTATATGELTSKNVGTYDANVTVSLSGDASVNYVLAEEVLNTSVEIYKKDITASVVAED